MTFVPLCMDADELRDWTRHNATLAPASRATRPCQDCMPKFAAEMRAIRRCNGEPGGEDRDEPLPRRRKPVAVESSGVEKRRALITLTVPCGACVKSDVCVLKPQIERMGVVKVETPPLDELLDVEIAGKVTCRAFMGRPRTRSPRAKVPE